MATSVGGFSSHLLCMAVRQSSQQLEGNPLLLNRAKSWADTA